MFTLILLAGLGASQPPQASSPPVRPGVMRKARDPNIAVQEELDLARKAGTVAAYDLFIARHPKHALAQIACKERALVAAKQR